MAIMVTSKEFNQRASAVLKMSAEQPVFITKWGKVVSVLSSYDDYQHTKQAEPSFEELFANSSLSEVSAPFFAEFEESLQVVRKGSVLRKVDFE